MEIKELLSMCCCCKKIKISDSGNWISEEGDFKLYNQLSERFKGKITHTYCPKDLQKAKDSIDEYFNNFN